jgi:hypothetical protein
MTSYWMAAFDRLEITPRTPDRYGDVSSVGEGVGRHVEYAHDSHARVEVQG